MSKRILFLGGASYQLPAINKALKRGYYVILCSNNHLDPGVELANEYHNISISNHTALIDLAQMTGVDQVLGYVSETAMHSASAVSKALGLPGVHEQVLQTCVRKDMFRNFQASKQFPHPNYIVVSDNDFQTDTTVELSYPLIVKPVDSCGSRGVSRIETKEKLSDALQYAWNHSMKNMAIVEELVSPNNRQFTGDGFMMNGELAFFSFGEHIFDTKISKVTACGSLWPAEVPSDENRDIKQTIESHLSTIGYLNGPFNVDFRIDCSGKTVIIEIAPRNGANYFPQIIRYCTGVDLVAAIFDRLDGKLPDFEPYRSNYVASFVLYSTQDGVINKVSIAKELEQWILQKDMFKQSGDVIRRFQHLGNSAGIVNFGFESTSEFRDVVANREQIFNITLRNVTAPLNTSPI